MLPRGKVSNSSRNKYSRKDAEILRRADEAIGHERPAGMACNAPNSEVGAMEEVIGIKICVCR